MIQTRHSLFVVEIKFSKSELTAAVVQEVRKKVEALTTPRNLSIRPVLVVEKASQVKGFKYRRS